jgi:hypothetical protein
MTDDPPGFAEGCFTLLGFINIGWHSFPVDVPALDKWIEEYADEDSRNKYLRKRAAAVEAYVEYERKRASAPTHWASGLDALREAVEDMHGIVHSLRAQGLAHAKARANQANRKNATKPRLKARAPLTAAIRRLMKRYKADSTEFKVFIKAWEAEALERLRLIETRPSDVIHPSEYLVIDENGDDSSQRSYTSNTLRAMYSRR